VIEPNEVASPPTTGNAPIDNALLGLADLPSAPLSDHHDRLAKAHEVLHQALDPSGDHSETAEPR
jgi:hypothetical protein